MNDHLAAATHMTKELIDASAILTTGLVLLDAAPKIAALLSCVWLSIRIVNYFLRREWRLPPMKSDE